MGSSLASPEPVDSTPKHAKPQPYTAQTKCFAVQPFHWHGLADDTFQSPENFQLLINGILGNWDFGEKRGQGTCRADFKATP